MGLRLVARAHLGIAEEGGPDVRPEHTARFVSLERLETLGLGPHLGVQLPLGTFARRVGRGPTFFALAFVSAQRPGGNLGIVPRRGHDRSRLLGLAWRLKTLRLQVKKLFVNGFGCALGRVVHTGVRPRKRCLGPHHQPPLRHTIVTQLEWLRACRLLETLPRVPRERLPDHRRDQLQRAWYTRDNAKLLEIGGMVFAVPFGIGHQVARCGGTLKGCQERWRALLEDLRVRSITIPTCTP